MKAKPVPKARLRQFGKAVASLRKANGLTQESLAEKLDLNSRHLQKIEAGEVSPSFGLLHQLRAQLRVSWEQLLGD